MQNMIMTSLIQKSGMPVGLQVIAANRGEAKLLNAAKFVEDVFGFSTITPIDPKVTHLG